MESLFGGDDNGYSSTSKRRQSDTGGGSRKDRSHSMAGTTGSGGTTPRSRSSSNATKAGSGGNGGASTNQQQQQQQQQHGHHSDTGSTVVVSTGTAAATVDDDDGFILDKDGLLRLPPEVEEGNHEYKLTLAKPSDARLEHLVTQMKWRLAEGKGEAIYEIGVDDDGEVLGLCADELAASIQTLQKMTRRLNAEVVVLTSKSLSEHLKLAEAKRVERESKASYTDSSGGGGGVGLLHLTAEPAGRTDDPFFSPDQATPSPSPALDRKRNKEKLRSMKNIADFIPGSADPTTAATAASGDAALDADTSFSFSSNERLLSPPSLASSDILTEPHFDDDDDSDSNNTSSDDFRDAPSADEPNDESAPSSRRPSRHSLGQLSGSTPLPASLQLSSSVVDLFATSPTRPSLSMDSGSQKRPSYSSSLDTSTFPHSHTGGSGKRRSTSSSSPSTSVSPKSSASRLMYSLSPSSSSSLSFSSSSSPSQPQQQSHGLAERYFARALIRKLPEAGMDGGSFSETTNIAVLGGVDAGKSTLLGVLAHGTLDNGRGRARLNLFRHKHEIESGRTSSVSYELMGFDSNGEAIDSTNCNGLSGGTHEITLAGNNQPATWADICASSSKLLMFMDLAGHEKYLKTTVSNLTGQKADYAALIVGASSGVGRMTREHLGLLLTLRVPFFVVVTKIDTALPRQLSQTLSHLQQMLESPTCGRTLIWIEKSSSQLSKNLTNLASTFASRQIIPIFKVSNVTGEGFAELRKFLSALPGPSPRNSDIFDRPAQFQVDETFNVPDVGVVLSGPVLEGTVHVGDELLAGPDEFGDFRPVVIGSIHRNRVPCKAAKAGQIASLAVGMDGARSDFRKGMALLSPSLTPVACMEFDVLINVILADSVIHPKFSSTIHVGGVRQTGTVVSVMDSETLEVREKKLSGEDQALIRVRFNRVPEYVTPGAVVLLCDTRTRAVGQVVKVYPYEGDSGPGPTSSATLGRPASDPIGIVNMSKVTA